MTTLTTAIQQALAELEKGDTLCEINAAHILRQALAETAAPQAVVQRDAERYRGLRKQYWNDVALCAVAQPKKSVKLGFDCPSLDRLDGFIDVTRAAQKGK